MHAGSGQEKEEEQEEWEDDGWCQEDRQRLHRAGQRASLHDLLHCIDGWMDG